MDTKKIASLTPEESARFAAVSSSKEIQSAIPHMNTDQIAAAVEQISEAHDADWQKKTRAAVVGLTDRPKLEALGRVLSPAQTLDLIDTALQIQDKSKGKLPAILVGMPHETFSKVLARASAKQIHVFQHEGVTEPVQHHLTILGHEFNREIDELIREIDLFVARIDSLVLDELSRDDVLEMQSQIESYRERFEALWERSNKALAVAWNTNRIDLIEVFNKAKDSCQKYLSLGVGSPALATTPSTGLFAKLEGKLFTVFGNPSDPEDFEALREDEPVMEALVKFSVWYLKDYWEMGLVPSIKKVTDLDLSLDKHTEAERLNYRQALFAEAQKNLDALGLHTLKDLKNVWVFSRKSLLEYIQEKARI